MALSLERLQSGDTIAADGVFIPLTDLPGMSVGDLTSSGNEYEAKFFHSLVNLLSAFVVTTSVLGLSVTRTPAVAVVANEQVINDVWVTTVLEIIDNTVSDVKTPIPLPSSGSFSGQGGLAIQNIFPNAAKVSAAAIASAPGISIPSSLIVGTKPAGIADHTAISLSDDGRSYLFALMEVVYSDITLRTTTLSSAVTAKPAPVNSTPALAAALTAATNPTSGITTPLTQVIPIQRSLSVTLQSTRNSDLTWSYRVATA